MDVQVAKSPFGRKGMPVSLSRPRTTWFGCESIRDCVALFAADAEEFHAAKTKGGFLSQPAGHAGRRHQIRRGKFIGKLDIERLPQISRGL